jgi:hypothetical protein
MSSNQQSRLGFDTAMRLIRRTVSGVEIPLAQAITSPPEDEDEEIGGGYGGGGASYTTADDDMDAEGEQGEDLFGSTFGPKSQAHQSVEVEDDDDDDDDDEDDDKEFIGLQQKWNTTKTSSANKDDGKGKPTPVTNNSKPKSKSTKSSNAAPGPAAPLHDLITATTEQPHEHHALDDEHCETCNRTGGVTTPPPPLTSPDQDQNIKTERSPTYSLKPVAPPAGKSAPEKAKAKETRYREPEEADLLKNHSALLITHEKWHTKAKHFIPRLDLAPHRYWIGVLNQDKKPKNASSEKHFTWMKGNRVTTIATIWHKFQELTMTEDFVLLLGEERTEMRDKCEELDYFDDKVIILRPVAKGLPQAKGRKVSEGVVPVVVELELDGEGE